MVETDPIAEIYRKIERERTLMQAAQHMKANSNPVVQASLDAQIKEGKKNIGYLEQKLQELESRRAGQGHETRGQGQSSDGRPLPPGKQGQNAGGYMQQPDQQSGYEYGSTRPGAGYADQLGAGTGMMPPRPPYGPTSPAGMPKARPNYSRLDLIKADTPYLGPRFQLMLSQLTFKLSVEKQYKDGIEKLWRLYQDDGDRKSKSDAEARRIESNQKIQLLRQALKRYEDLHVDMAEPDIEDDDSINSPQLRKPLSGHLTVRVQAVRDVNHALTNRFSRGVDTFVVIKVEDAFKGRTKVTRTDKWTEELHNIEVDKANEIELTVFDKSGQYPTPIGMLWIRISDLMEEMRRKKVEAELSGSQWMTADQLDRAPGSRNGPGQQPHGMNPNMQLGGLRSPTMMGGSQGPGDDSDPNVIDAWFALEPVGSIKLAMSFTKQNRGKVGFDIGLNRKGAVRQRKEEVQEQYGHRFVKQQFYSIMRCALCGQFLKNAAGMQCEDCKYTCHAECFTKVVTKCISKSNAESDPDEEKLNHRIPHRFEQYMNMGANWCCHCGYLLNFGRKNARKCSECGITVHGSCSHLVPDFCGMSMQRANEILIRIRGIPKKPPPISHKLADRTLRSDRPGSRPQVGTQPSFDAPPTAEDTSRPDVKSRGSYGYEPPFDAKQSQVQSTYGMAAAQSAAAKVSSAAPAERPSYPARTSSQDPKFAAAAAASTALTGQRPGQYGQGDYAPRPGIRTSDSYGSAESPSELAAQASPDRKRVSQPQQPPLQKYDPSAYAAYQGGYQQQPPVQHYPQQPATSQYMDMAQAQQQAPQTVVRPPQAPAKEPIPQQGQQVMPTIQQPAAQRRIGLEHFNFLAVLGKGNFGKVMLAETKATKKLYAIKVLKKEFIIENDEVESTKSEKRVFLVANKERHPFLLNLHACFQTETRVYFVMEYISGGDLMLHIQRGQFGLKRAQFYASEVCLALKYFHENGVIYRDLKLDNILLTLDGHIKIADYGLCKEDMWYGSSTSTFCGTPEFMAPEILLDKKYGRAVDWWAFGVLIYQMLLQQSPFRGEDEDEIYDAILSDEPLYPIHMPRDSVSILQKLLTREPELRLGSGPTDAQEIMSHAFFRTTNWDEVREKRVAPPFIPTIKSATDTSNFDSEFTSVTPVLTPVQSVLTQAMQEEFRGFSYVADFT